MAKIIDGRKLAEKIKTDLKTKVAKLDRKPGLAVVLVGDNPASQIYVKAKVKACQQVGFYSKKILLSASVSQKTLLTEIKKLNETERIDGILVQFPLPEGLSEAEVSQTIAPDKDVDLFHPENVGRFYLKKQIGELSAFLAPCTPKGIIKLIEETEIAIEGKEAVIVGRSNLVGKPVAELLLKKNATPTICHSRTKNLSQQTRKADILIVAAGRPKIIKASMVKEGAIVVDVGINRTENGLVGDVDFDQVKKKAAWITPVPGGVGPMTIATLLENTLILNQKI